MNTRIYKLDALKMFLMILVIFGHIPMLGGFLNTGLPSCYDSVTLQTMKGIYAFHMPLFVIISGYFTRRKLVKEQIKGSLKLLKFYVIFQLFDLLIQSLATGELPTFYRCLHPSFALWYLLCLFYWRVLISFIPEKVNSKFILVISFFISIMIGFTPVTGVMGLHRFFSFMPYFMIGHYYGETALKYVDKCIMQGTFYKIGLSFVFVALMFIVSFNPYWLSVIISPYNRWEVFIIRIVYLGYSLLLSYLLFLIFSFKKNWHDNIFSKSGSNTLFFYLIHPYVLYMIVRLWSYNDKAINLVDACLITITVTIVLYSLNKVKLLNSIIK